MKITRLTTTPLTLGKSLLRVETDAGIEGWSEVPGRNNRVFDGYLEGVIAPVLVGKDPRLIDRHWETLALGREERFFKLPGWVVGVVDVALWDILGKDTGLPVPTLMGGARRTTIPLYWSTGQNLVGFRCGSHAGRRRYGNGMFHSSAPIEIRMNSIASARMRCDVSPRRLRSSDTSVR